VSDLTTTDATEIWLTHTLLYRLCSFFIRWPACWAWFMYLQLCALYFYTCWWQIKFSLSVRCTAQCNSITSIATFRWHLVGCYVVTYNSNIEPQFAKRLLQRRFMIVLKSIRLLTEVFFLNNEVSDLFSYL